MILCPGKNLTYYKLSQEALRGPSGSPSSLCLPQSTPFLHRNTFYTRNISIMQQVFLLRKAVSRLQSFLLALLFADPTFSTDPPFEKAVAAFASSTSTTAARSALLVAEAVADVLVPVRLILEPRTHYKIRCIYVCTNRSSEYVVSVLLSLGPGLLSRCLCGP